MIPNKERLGIEIAIRPQVQPVELIKSELIKVNYSIDRKFAILDEYSANWTFTEWRNFKDALQAELSYREYLKIVLEAYQK